ncbi:hypothetical protein J4408_01940 [Candidatus Pacearchaeota archaeon]|nr:hypothetical protein [Candidatus Pacearchaeota archaeon]
MLPRYHILLGTIFTLLILIILPGINLIYLSLIFLSSFLIDFDHYAMSVIKTGKISLLKSFDYHNKARIVQEKEIRARIKRKGDFHLFHTIEFHLFVGLLGLIWIGFFYVFIGMVFHSLLDIYDGLKKGWLYRREFFFFNWISKKLII